jgi:hypothetical protein
MGTDLYFFRTPTEKSLYWNQVDRLTHPRQENDAQALCKCFILISCVFLHP